MSADSDEFVLIYLDGEPRYVQRVAGTARAAREALGLPRHSDVSRGGQGYPRRVDVAREEDITVTLSFANGWTFKTGDRYVRIGMVDVEVETSANPEEPDSFLQEQDWRGGEHKDAGGDDWWKGDGGA